MSKDVLIELLKKSLEERLKYVENRSDEHVSALQHTKNEFEKFTNVIDGLVKMRKEKEIAELQEKEKAEKGGKEDNKKKDDKKKNDKTNTTTKSSSSNATTTTTGKKTLKPAQSSANIITQKPAKSSKANKDLTIETNNKGKRTQTPGGGKRTKTEPSNVSRNTMPVSSASARGSVQGGGKSGSNTNRSSSKPSTKKSAVSKGKGDKTSASKDKNVSTPSSSASTTKNKNDKATTTTTTTKFQPIIESKEETTVNDVVNNNNKQEQTLLSKVIAPKPKTLLETLQDKLLISEHIFPYLTEDDKMNLLFTNKKLFIKNLQEVFTLKKQTKLKSLNVLIGQTIDDKIDELKNVSTHIYNTIINRVSQKKTS